MHQLFLVAQREFLQRVRTRGFIISTIALPLILIVALAGSNFMGSSGTPDQGADSPAAEAVTVQQENTATTALATGYVDRADLITRIPAPLPPGSFVEFADTAAAEVALAADEISAYYVVAADYRESGSIQRVARELPAGPPQVSDFEWLLVSNVFPESAPPDIARLRTPFQSQALSYVPTQVAAGDDVTESSGNPMLPFLVAMLVMIPLFTSGSYLLYSVTQEKSNRVMEILLVSLRPRQLLLGKLIGLGALTLVQYTAWVAIGLGAMLAMGQDISALTGALNLSGMELLLILVYAAGGFLLYAALMAGIGALSPNLESSRSWVFILTLPMLIPIYLWVGIAGNPNGPLAVALSLIPFSAPLAMLMRLASAAVPAWQIGLSITLLFITAVGIVWLMSRLFRVQTLLSGESFSAKRFWDALATA